MYLNCDLGENVDGRGVELDAQLMPFIDQANVACGVHAGDAEIASKVLDLAAQHDVAIGAHPSYPDRENFGRKSMQLSESELTASLLDQIAWLDNLVKGKGLALTYVKPHGALYNDIVVDAGLRNVVLQAIASYSTDLSLMVLSTAAIKVHKAEAAELGINLLAEVFADRCYTDDGQLLSREYPDAVHNEAAIVAQVSQLVRSRSVSTRGGNQLFLAVDSVCLHGDNPESVKTIARVGQIVHRGREE